MFKFIHIVRHIVTYYKILKTQITLRTSNTTRPCSCTRNCSSESFVNTLNGTTSSTSSWSSCLIKTYNSWKTLHFISSYYVAAILHIVPCGIHSLTYKGQRIICSRHLCVQCRNWCFCCRNWSFCCSQSCREVSKISS